MVTGIPFTCIFYVALLHLWMNNRVSAMPHGLRSTESTNTPPSGGYDIPIMTSKARNTGSRNRRRGDVSGSIGVGNSFDLLYTVPIEVGNNVFAVNLDTGSSDLWIVSDTCRGNACNNARVSRYPQTSLISAGTGVNMTYGDSTTGTFASGTVGLDTATIAGVSMAQQAFGLINDTSNKVVQLETAGIFGLSFPAASRVQQAVVESTGSIDTTDEFIESTYTSGPLLSRIAMTGALELPMFTIQFQRNTIDVGGEGLLTLGKLPDGVDNSSLTWVPVRPYSVAEGGMDPPSFAPNEVYPFRWEIDIDGVFLDGQRVPDSTLSADGVDSKRVSALIDTGNSLLRGPEDVVNSILSTVSPLHNPNSDAPASLPCNEARTLAFQIGGKLFPVDPRDFIGQLNPNDAVTCQADNLVPTDPPSVGALFRWSLGAPFFRSNLVAFHYGNLTHPSVDPPRIGFLSNVPTNAHQLLQDAVQDAIQNGGNFPSVVIPAPTASAASEPRTTVFLGSAPAFATPTSRKNRTNTALDTNGDAPIGIRYAEHTLLFTLQCFALMLFLYL